MKNQISLIFILAFLFFSCKSDNLKEVLKTSQNPELDMVYHTVVKTEFQNNGSSIAIIDQASEKNSMGTAEFDSISNSEKKKIFWNKSIFPKAIYISKDSLVSYMKQENKFWEFAKEHQFGWIEISKPIFFENKAKVIIEVSFSDPNNKFGYSHYYILEKRNGEYVIIEKKMTEIS